MIQATIRSLKGVALDDAQQELERMGARRNEIEARLAQINSGQRTDARPAEQVVDDAIAVLANESRHLLTLSGEPLRDAVNRLIANISVDMETKTVEMSVALPVWATAVQPKRRLRRENEDAPVCPAITPWSPIGGWTHTPMIVADCRYERVRGSRTIPPCYICSRKAA